jgi:hypothetical protein
LDWDLSLESGAGYVDFFFPKLRATGIGTALKFSRLGRRRCTPANNPPIDQPTKTPNNIFVAATSVAI